MSLALILLVSVAVVLVHQVVVVRAPLSKRTDSIPCRGNPATLEDALGLRRVGDWPRWAY